MTTKREGDDMPIKAEWQRVNLWSVGAVFLGALMATAGNAYWFGGTIENIKGSIAATQSDVADLQAAQAKRGEQADAAFQRINDKLPQFEVVNQQILRLAEQTAENRKMTEALNDRLERQQTQQADKLDKLIDAVADLRGDMKSVQSQLADPNRVNRTQSPVLRLR
jgi:septal ring factor EnvC (AmiA/AmiB activator)